MFGLGKLVLNFNHHAAVFVPALWGIIGGNGFFIAH
jgi:hypothetical protein